MTIAELLKAQGLDDDQVSKVLAAMKENKIYTAGEENLDVRYGKLKDEHTGTLTELENANGLIKELQKSSKGNEELQTKIAEYETKNAELQKQLADERLDAAIKVGLLSAHALDVDYLTFKLRASGDLELDDNGNVKGWEDKLGGLKTQFPAQFEGDAAGEKRIDEHRLGKGQEGDKGVTRSDVFKMSYAEREKLYRENPEGFNELMKG